MNNTVALIRYAIVAGKGWRRGAAIFTKNGKLRHESMMYGGLETHCPSGRYQLRHFVGRRPMYTELGNDPADALDRYRTADAKSKLRAAAKLAGIEIATPDTVEGKKTLKAQAQSFMEKHRSSPHRSDDAEAVYMRVTETFLTLCKAKYPEQIKEDDVIRWHGWMRREMKYSDRTAANYYVSLRGFLRYCGLDPKKIISEGTHTLLKKYTKKKPNTYTPEQVAACCERRGAISGLSWSVAAIVT